MNETFDIQRIGKLFVYEVTNYLPRFFKSLMIASGVLVAVWLLSLVATVDIMDYGREELINSLYFLMLLLSPYIIYKDMNNRKKGYMYAMIPASTLEKLISMLLVCGTVVPAVAYLSLTLTDVVLYVFSQLGVGTFENIAFSHPFYAVSDSMSWFDNVIGVLCSVTTAMMFNSIFRKNKIFKTVLFNIIVVFSLTIIVLLINNIISPEFVERVSNWFADFFYSFPEERLESLAMWTLRLFYIVWIATTLGITYYRIKKVNYCRIECNLHWWYLGLHLPT